MTWIAYYPDFFFPTLSLVTMSCLRYAVANNMKVMQADMGRSLQEQIR